MGTFLKRLLFLVVLAVVAWKVNELMTIQRAGRTPALPQT